ncbi:hypothetical protein A2954_03185 [Candidatus Roizmanbacteria bacterium RIFCSPLOWO2_01_FULL_37_12]|uniref:Uncharacterized protein n=1 Tax=Candidatus Roizmanbacteria bacterium RIFCSPLOWO2_01_FULL_37_12 TaxID=1802056 RepID=A0A1F7IAI0_9BACT|nr:MAG: hypothetical protein A2954_03185 [Candidatus Roizmanbacteria bacterium RIFCSPLOWO2_01_FULL_37_12]
MSNKAVLNEIKKLKNINIPYGEIEYLYDNFGKNEGIIDPNLIGGGFTPFNLIKIPLDLLYENLKEPVNYRKSHFYRKSVQLLVDFFKRNNITSGIDNSEHLASNVTSLLFKIVSYNFENEELAELTKNLFKLDLDLKNNFFSQYLFKKSEIVARLMSGLYGWSFISSFWWITHRMNLVKIFYDKMNSNQSIFFLKNIHLQNINNFINNYIDSQGLISSLENNLRAQSISVYKIDYLADHGYFIKHVLERRFKNISVNVYLDILKTGLYSLVPFEAIFSLFGGEKKNKIIHYIKNAKVSNTSTEYNVVDLNNNFSLTYLKEKKQAHLKFNKKINVFTNFKTVDETITPIYNSYMHTFSQISSSYKIKLENKFDRMLFLANAINPKSLLFYIADQVESDYKFTFNKPTTKIILGRKILLKEIKYLFYNGKIVFKEGSDFNTYDSVGGKSVHILNKQSLSEFDKVYPSTVVQSFVTSNLFSFHNKKLHGHIRILSIFDGKGNICNLGWGIKLSVSQNKFNSSGFKSIILYYDEKKNFVYGYFNEKNKIFFTSIKESDLKLQLKKTEFDKLLDRALTSWIKAIYILNKYFETDIKPKINDLVNKGIINKRYFLHS